MAPYGDAKALLLRRPDRCAVCERELPVGHPALWHREARVVTCRTCGLAPAEVFAGVAGASARREYDRRHTAREDVARQNFGIIGVGAARVFGEPQHTTSWRRGADGEERVAARLERLLGGSGVRLLHDRRAPGTSRANIDHIAVGPGGVTVIDAKNVRGRVRKDRVGGLFQPRHDVLLIDRRDRTALVHGVERQVASIRTVLQNAGHPDIDVQGALCFVDVYGLPLLRSLRIEDIVVDGPRAAADLAKRKGALSAAEVDALWTMLATALPPA